MCLSHIMYECCHLIIWPPLHHNFRPLWLHGPARPVPMNMGATGNTTHPPFLTTHHYYTCCKLVSEHISRFIWKSKSTKKYFNLVLHWNSITVPLFYFGCCRSRTFLSCNGKGMPIRFHVLKLIPFCRCLLFISDALISYPYS